MNGVKLERLMIVSCVLLALATILAPVVQSLGERIVANRDVDYLADVDYADNKDKLDIFMPEGASNVPVVVFFHGGGLQRGNKSAGEVLAKTLVPQGIGVVTANYRLSPGVMHPAHIEDATAAFVWTLDKIESYGGDPERVFVAGHSAGAYLATLMSLDPSYLRAHRRALSDVRGAIPVSPFLYVEEVAPDRPKTVWGTDVEVWRQASVKPYLSSGKPPILLIYADGDADWRREQNDRLEVDLKAAGHSDVKAIEIANRTHGSVMTNMGNPGDSGIERVAVFIKSY